MMSYYSYSLVAIAGVILLSSLTSCNAKIHLRGRKENENATHDHHHLVEVTLEELSRRHNKKHSFDFYVLSMSWQPEFCYQHRKEGYPGCEHPQDTMRSSLTLHGLWPQFEDGTWPSTCSNEKFDPEVVDDIGEQRFEKFWPNVKSSEHSREHFSFWEHEWTKHGTCSGLTQIKYFETALDHFLQTPDMVHENYGGSVSKADLEYAYGAALGDDQGDVVLVCSAGKFLSEVRICIGKNEDGTGSERIECIPEVVDEGNCEEDVFISMFYNDYREHGVSADQSVVEIKVE